MKANPLIRMLEVIKETGVGSEVASFPELTIALKTGYNANKIVFDSPVKTRHELEFALKEGVHINIDSFAEIERITEIRRRFTPTSTIGIRINPQVGTGTIVESSVAGEYSKFGIPIKTRKDKLRDILLVYPWITGVHLHVGSQGCSMQLLLNGISVLYDFVLEVNEKRIKYGMPPISIFDIGGGFPISYFADQEPPSMETYAMSIKEQFPLLFTSHISLLTEFGRWIHTNAGWTISRVEYVKREAGINTAMIHVGADLFLRECLIPKNWQHEYILFDKKGNQKTGEDQNSYNLAGPLCFSGDILAHNVKLPVAEEGDYLVICDTGGYTLSMWSRYNSRQIPRVLGYRGATFEILKEREEASALAEFWK